MNYVICINNDNYNASLILGKKYRTIEDKDAEKHNQIRIVDESGESYLYDKLMFVPFENCHEKRRN